MEMQGITRGAAGMTALLFAAIALPLAPLPAPGQEYPAAYQQQLEKQWRAHPTLEIGAPAPAFSLKGIDGKFHSLDEYKASRILAVVFICNHCPASQLYEERILKLTADYAPKGVQVVAIQPNGPVAMAPRELNYSDLDDSFDSMVEHARYRHFTFPYLYDGDTQEVASKFGPKVTPHIFLFDSDRKLRFQGRIDDSMNETKIKTRDARAALDALLAGAKPPLETTPVFGCSTKWNNQIENRDRELAEWKALPVTLESAGAADLKKLRANSSGKTVMVYFWSLQCPSCLAEFHNLVTTHLWYRSREFELVTVSTDPPARKDAVLQYLQKEHVPVRNFQFESADTRALQAAFDDSWKSPAPFILVIAPDGKIVYREERGIGILPLRRAILATLPDAGMFAGNTAYWAKK